MKILHIVPNSATKENLKYLGSTKDIAGRTEYFQEQRIEFFVLPVKGRDDKGLISIIDNYIAQGFDAVVIEFTTFRRTVKYLKSRYPTIRILCRSHNEELLHWIDYARAEFKYGSAIKALLRCVRALRFFYHELICARYADAILTISSWEREHYWPNFAKNNKILNVPYFLPSSYVPPLVTGRVRGNRCVCLMSTSPNNLLKDSAINFLEFVKIAKAHLPLWEFSITGDISSFNMKIPDDIIQVGLLSNPIEYIATAKCIAILSNYGRGFKTKILDAVLEGCYVLLFKKLYYRQPKILQQFCMVIDFKDPQTIVRALQRATTPLPAIDPNHLLREEAFCSLDKALNI